MTDIPIQHVDLRKARRAFFRRLIACIAAAAVLIGVSLFAGVVGYHYFEDLSWTDAFLNASMILSGMGQVNELRSSGGKIFAGCFALYSGLVLILATGIILAPFVHFVLHRFHLESKTRD